MKRLAFWFCNPDERRPRALWRLLLQSALLMLALYTLAPLGALLPETPLVIWTRKVGFHVVVILTIWVACRALDNRRFADLGFSLDRAWWSDLVCGLVLGGILMAAVFFLAVAAGWVELHARPVQSGAISRFPLALFLLFVSYLAVGLGEEVFFRGYLLRNLAEGLNLRWIGARGALMLSMLGTSVIFAGLHSHHAHSTLLSWMNTFIGGLLLAVGFACGGRLGLPIGFHLTWNFFQEGVCGFAVSGNEIRAALVTIDDHGPPLWTGGSYGPEGGLLGTAAFLVGIVLTLTWNRLRYGPLGLKTTLAEYRRPTASDGHRADG